MSPGLFLHVASIEARARLGYRARFWVNAAAGFLADFGVVWFLWAAVFATSGAARIGGRDQHGTIVYFLAVILLGKFVRGERFSAGMAASQDIYEGSLTRYLLFPAPYFWFKYAQNLGSMAPALLEVAVFGALAIGFLGGGGSAAVTPASVAMAIVAVAVANLLWFTLEFTLRLVAFWADNVWSLEVALWFCSSILGGWMLPLSVFPAGARRVIDLLPFRFFFDFPVRVLLGEIGVAEWARLVALGFVWCVVFGALRRFTWRRGQLQYTGVGI